MYESQFITDL